MTATQLDLLVPDTGVASVPAPAECSPPARARLTLKPSAVRCLAVIATDPWGATAAQVATVTGYQQNAASKRCGELEALGLVRVVASVEGPRSRWLKVYRATPDGFDALPEVVE